MPPRPRPAAPARPALRWTRRAPAVVGATSEVCVGMDLVSATDVRESIDRFGERYLARLFTPAERVYCERDASQAASRFAARMAAKEAVRKVLRPESGLEFRDVEVVREPDGAPLLRLHGRTRRRAADLGFVAWSVSLTHDAGVAGAVVVGTRLVRKPRSTEGDPRP